MKSNELLLCLALPFTVLTTYAQTQSGYVKTLGRPGQKGKALSGVAVRVKGEHNPVLSRKDGTFELLMKGKKNGDAYSLQQVQKSGYELNEVDVIGRRYAFSDRVPLTIIMVSSAQLQADKQRISNNAFNAADKNYKAQLALLNKQKDEGKISAEKYRTERQNLQDKFEKYQGMIGELANHYAHVDYDNLDKKEREINICIEKGKLERADSLIHTLFDPADVLKHNKEALSKLDQQLAEGRYMLNKANADMAAVLKQQEKDAEYLYLLYTIALSGFDNQKAERYIVTRAELDTLNVEWQIQTGEFLATYLSDYDKAEAIYQRALKNSISTGGEKTVEVAECYNHIGNIHYQRGEYDSALEYHKKALAIQEEVLSEGDLGFSSTYNQMGMCYDLKGDSERAFDNYNRSLNSVRAAKGEIHPTVAAGYNNLSAYYLGRGNVTKSIEYQFISLGILKQVYGEKHPDVAANYINISNLYLYEGKADSAIVYIKKAYSLSKKLFGKQHPYIARILVSQSNAYGIKGEYAKAIESSKKSLSITERLFGDNHSEVAICYNNIGYFHYCLGQYEKSLENNKKALAIRQAIYGEKHSDIAQSLDNIGMACLAMGDLDEAEECHTQALSIRTEVQGERHFDLAWSYIGIGDVYCAKGKYTEALEYYKKAYDVRINAFGESHPYLVPCYEKMGDAYMGNKEVARAQEYYQKAYELSLKLSGEKDETTQRIKKKIEL